MSWSTTATRMATRCRSSASTIRRTAAPSSTTTARRANTADDFIRYTPGLRLHRHPTSSTTPSTTAMAELTPRRSPSPSPRSTMPRTPTTNWYRTVVDSCCAARRRACWATTSIRKAHPMTRAGAWCQRRRCRAVSSGGLYANGAFDYRRLPAITVSIPSTTRRAIRSSLCETATVTISVNARSGCRDDPELRPSGRCRKTVSCDCCSRRAGE